MFSFSATSRLRSQHSDGSGVVVNIGDGLLDANAYPASDAFIGYIGVVQKKKALEKAMLYVDSYDSLIQILLEGEWSCLFSSVD